jgi:hypothetical protein
MKIPLVLKKEKQSLTKLFDLTFKVAVINYGVARAHKTPRFKSLYIKSHATCHLKGYNLA